MLRRIEHATRNTAAASFWPRSFWGWDSVWNRFLHKVRTVLQNSLGWNFVFGKSLLGSAWGSFGPDVEQAWSQARSRSRTSVLPERSKRCSKTMEPTTRICDLGCSLEGFREVKSNSLKSQILEGICFNFVKATKTKFQHNAFCKKTVVLEIDFKIDAEQH